MFRRDGLLAEIPRRMEMSTLSWTKPGVARGPHEHRRQTDNFFFIGPSRFRLYLWDNRPGSLTYKTMMVDEVGESNMAAVIVPPGVVHGYKNIGTVDGLSLNFPDKLYRGEGGGEEVDEIRHEKNKENPFVMD